MVFMKRSRPKQQQHALQHQRSISPSIMSTSSSKATTPSPEKHPAATTAQHHSSSGLTTTTAVSVSSTTTRSCLKQQQQPVNTSNPGAVRFGEVRIREFERIIGDNPSCSSGAPISIGWRHAEERRMPLHDYEVAKLRRLQNTHGMMRGNGNGSNKRTAPTSRTAASLVLTRHEREHLLLDWGASLQEIVESIRTNVRIKHQRRRTVNNRYDRWEEVMEKASRKIKKTLAVGSIAAGAGTVATGGQQQQQQQQQRYQHQQYIHHRSPQQQQRQQHQGYQIGPSPTQTSQPTRSLPPRPVQRTYTPSSNQTSSHQYHTDRPASPTTTAPVASAPPPPAAYLSPPRRPARSLSPTNITTTTTSQQHQENNRSATTYKYKSYHRSNSNDTETDDDNDDSLFFALELAEEPSESSVSTLLPMSSCGGSSVHKEPQKTQLFDPNASGNSFVSDYQLHSIHDYDDKTSDPNGEEEDDDEVAMALFHFEKNNNHYSNNTPVVVAPVPPPPQAYYHPNTNTPAFSTLCRDTSFWQVSQHPSDAPQIQRRCVPVIISEDDDAGDIINNMPMLNNGIPIMNNGFMMQPPMMMHPGGFMMEQHQQQHPIGGGGGGLSGGLGAMALADWELQE